LVSHTYAPHLRLLESLLLLLLLPCRAAGHVQALLLPATCSPGSWCVWRVTAGHHGHLLLLLLLLTLMPVSHPHPEGASQQACLHDCALVLLLLLLLLLLSHLLLLLLPRSLCVVDCFHHRRPRTHPRAWAA
jgi:hypothetical protein